MRTVEEEENINLHLQSILVVLFVANVLLSKLDFDPSWLFELIVFLAVLNLFFPQLPQYL